MTFVNCLRQCLIEYDKTDLMPAFIDEYDKPCHKQECYEHNERNRSDMTKTQCEFIPAAECVVI